MSIPYRLTLGRSEDTSGFSGVVILEDRKIRHAVSIWSWAFEECCDTVTRIRMYEELGNNQQGIS